MPGSSSASAPWPTGLPTRFPRREAAPTKMGDQALEWQDRRPVHLCARRASTRKRKAGEKALEYFDTHRPRMRYDLFRQKDTSLAPGPGGSRLQNPRLSALQMLGYALVPTRFEVPPLHSHGLALQPLQRTLELALIQAPNRQHDQKSVAHPNCSDQTLSSTLPVEIVVA